eukprot:8155708-Ditylum_brightwellii.AAC.1
MINWAQLTAGVSKSIVQTHQCLSQIKGQWVHQLRLGLKYINAKIHIHNIWTYPVVREHNSHVMDSLLQLQLYNNKIQKINHCHLFLRVTHVSDVAASDGKCIHPDAVDTDPSCFFNGISTLEWPIQSMLNRQS